MKKKIIFLFLMILVPNLAFAAQGNPDNGEKLYQKRCWWCHGETGAGDGPAAKFLVPPPRDFTSGIYKFKTTPFDEFVPAEEDFFLMIKGGKSTEHYPNWSGMNDSAMPGWGDILKDNDIWDLIAYIKKFADIEKNERPSIKIPSSRPDVKRGKELFKDRCVECHGEEGRGDGIKKLMDDWGKRTWPRNLTKPWSFRISNDLKDIYTRITVGVPGTQMPSFSDPISKKFLSDEDRWSVANYVASLANPLKKPGDNTVLIASKLKGDLPDKPEDPKWQEAAPTSYWLVPQIIAKERHFTPSLDSITARAFFNNKEIAILLEWDDRTRSIPGDSKAEEIAGQEVFEDAVSIQLPSHMPEGAKKPYFGMGDEKFPVNLWVWKSERTDLPQSVKLYNATGFDEKEERDYAKVGLIARGIYDKGTWRVMFKRSLATGEKDKDLQFEEGKYIPIAFAAWDGSNGEKGSRHVMTTWHWLILKPKTGLDVYIMPLLVGIAIFSGELLWLKLSSKKR